MYVKVTLLVFVKVNFALNRGLSITGLHTCKADLVGYEYKGC